MGIQTQFAGETSYQAMVANLGLDIVEEDWLWAWCLDHGTTPSKGAWEELVQWLAQSGIDTWHDDQNEARARWCLENRVIPLGFGNFKVQGRSAKSALADADFGMCLAMSPCDRADGSEPGQVPHVARPLLLAFVGPNWREAAEAVVAEIQEELARQAAN